MAETTPNMMNHVSIGTNQFEQAVQFYDAVLKTLGCKRIYEFPGAVAYGKQVPEFWVQTPIDGKPAAVGNGTHFGFNAASKKQVQQFYDAAIKAGGTDDGAPGLRPHYGEAYYGCFVRDLDGHKIEALYWDTTGAK